MYILYDVVGTQRWDGGRGGWGGSTYRYGMKVVLLDEIPWEDVMLAS